MILELVWIIVAFLLGIGLGAIVMRKDVYIKIGTVEVRASTVKEAFTLFATITSASVAQANKATAAYAAAKEEYDARRP